TGTLDLLETCEAPLDLVGARAQVGYLEIAVGVRRRLAREGRRFVGDDHGRAGDNLMLWIEHGSANRAESGLRKRGAAGSDHRGQRHRRCRAGTRPPDVTPTP